MIGQNSLRLLISQVAGNVGYLAAVVVLARALGPSERGTVAFITVTALVTSQLAMLGLSDATRVLGARSPGLRPALLANLALVAVLGAATASTLIGAVLAFVPGVRPKAVGAPELVILALATTAMATVVAGYAFLQGCGRFRPYSRVQATTPWLYAAALAVAHVTVGLTVAGAVAIWTLAHALAGLRLLAACVVDVGWSRPDLPVLRSCFRFGVRAWLGGTSRVLNARTDQIIAGIIATQATLGIYAVAVNASEVLYYLSVAAGAALVPAVAGGDETTGPERTVRIYRAVLLITLGGSLIAIAIGPLIVPLAFGSAYRSAVTPFLILVPSSLGFATLSVFSGASLGSFAPLRSSLGPLAALITQTTLDLVLIPHLGASGAALAATAALLLGGAVAAGSYRARFTFAWHQLLPRPADFTAIVDLARRILSTKRGSLASSRSRVPHELS